MLEPIYHKLKSYFGNNFQVFKTTQLPGGDINLVYKMESSAGTFCIKINDAFQFPHMFRHEFEGLNILRQNCDFKIPEAIEYNDVDGKSFLLMEFIESGNRTPDFWSKFGTSLANLHRQSSNTFGLESDNYIGSLMQPNLQSSNWADFYAGQRILTQIKLAFDSDLIDSEFVQRAELLCGKLESLIPSESPSLLHGDLWSGNFMINSNGNPVLIDPAVYYGHREMDIAMSKLFGGFSPEMYEAYHRTFPLESNWEDRITLHQLYPVLVHVNLFGGTYVQQASNILNQYL